MTAARTAPVAARIISMNRIVSVVTAARKPVPEYLAAACASIRSQVLPAGWDWQWVVQEDGETGAAAALLPGDPRISPGSGRWAGEPVTRNLCLSRAPGELIKVLDADDQLTPGALAREIAVLSAQPDIGWTTASALDLLPDGSTRGSAADPVEGRIEPGEVLLYWRTHGYRAQVHPASLCIRRDLVLALGGLDGPARIRGYRPADGRKRGHDRLLHRQRRAAVPEMAGSGNQPGDAHRSGRVAGPDGHHRGPRRHWRLCGAVTQIAALRSAATERRRCRGPQRRTGRKSART
jgi:glycosyltransferase involved in cell wall biosynthesis